MSNIIPSGFHPNLNFDLPEAKTELNRIENRQTFQTVLQQKEPLKTQETDNQNKQKGVEINQLEALRQDLINRYQKVQDEPALMNPPLDKNHIEDFRNLLKESIKEVLSSPKSEGVSGKVLQIEDQWKELEAMIFSGRNFSQAELLALQVKIYQVSQQVDLFSKMVEQVTGSVKTILNTNV